MQMVIDWLKKLIADVVSWVLGLFGLGEKKKPADPVEDADAESSESD